MFFLGKQKHVEAQIRAYGRQVALCLERTWQAIDTYFTTADRAWLGAQVDAVHQAENQADTIRRDVEAMMYGKSIFPESRGDVLGLLETLDHVPNQAETCPRSLYLEHLEVPGALKPGVLELLILARRCAEVLLEAVNDLFCDFPRALESVRQVDQLESQADQLENQLIETIFAGDQEGWRKILLKDLVVRISAICDRAQATSDRIRVIVAKRRI